MSLWAELAAHSPAAAVNRRVPLLIDLPPMFATGTGCSVEINLVNAGDGDLA